MSVRSAYWVVWELLLCWVGGVGVIFSPVGLIWALDCEADCVAKVAVWLGRLLRLSRFLVGWCEVWEFRGKLLDPDVVIDGLFVAPIHTMLEVVQIFVSFLKISANK